MPPEKTSGKKNTTPSTTRRCFLQNTLAGSVTVGTVLGTGSAPAQSAAETRTGGSSFDFTQSSAALSPSRTVRTACQFCNSLCGLDVEMKQGRVLSIRGLEADPVQAGEVCLKAPMMAQLLNTRHRLKHPLRRVGGRKGSPESRFEPCSWDQALDIVAKRWLALRDAGEAHTIANRTSGRMLRGAGELIGRILTLLGSPNATDVGPVCNDAGGNALAATFGLGNFTNGYGVDGATGKEDLGSADFFLFLGTNQAETHPVTFAHLLRCREKTGATLVVVDPRKTPTGAYADTWLAPKPHTDLALVLGMLGHILRHDLYDKGFVAEWALGFEELKAHVLDHGYSPEWAASRCDLDTDAIRRLAEDFAGARAAAIFCNAGVSHQLNAFTTYRALAILAAVTGNIGRPGTGCNFMHNTWPGGLSLPPMTVTPPEVTQPALPVGPDSFATSILDESPYRLRSVMTQGNPLTSSANTRRVQAAYEQLEFFVYTGLFMEESAWYADIILPVCSGLEFEGVYMRRDDRAIRWQEQAAPRVGDSKTDIEIFVRLAQALARNDQKNPPRYWTDQIRPEWADYSVLWDEFARRTPGVAGMTKARMQGMDTPLRWPCPTADHPGVSTLYLDHPSWYAAAESLDPAHMGKRFLTPSGKIEIFTPALDAQLAMAGHGALPVYFTHPEVKGQRESVAYADGLVANPVHPRALTPMVAIGVPAAAAHEVAFPLMGMSGRPSVVHFAGMTHWAYDGKQLNGVRLIQVHPKTAEAAGILDGDTITVESPRGKIMGTALLWEGIREDTVFVPNGFGPAQVLGDDFGLPRYEAANVLPDDRYFDNLSGQQAYKCFACRIEKTT